MSDSKVVEGLYDDDSWNLFSSNLTAYITSPFKLNFAGSRTALIGRSLRHAIVDLLDTVLTKPNEQVENDTTIMGTEHRLYHSRRYLCKSKDEEISTSEDNDDDNIELDISSFAPTVFYQLREDIGISNIDFRHSFAAHHLKDFTNPGKSGSLMYKSFDELFILKTLRKYEARLLMKILAGYHLKLTQRATLLNRYVGLYSIRFPLSICSTEIYVVIMANAFTPSLHIHEIFDLKGSKVKRKLAGHLSADKLHQLKDLDFTDLYPNGIRVPSHVYHRLHMTISNDVKVLRKLYITDFSLILGVRHLDMTEDDLVQLRPSAGLAALYHMSHKLGLMQLDRFRTNVSSPTSSRVESTSLPVSYLKPLQMIGESVDADLYYAKDKVARAALPIPGMANRSNKRVYLYLAIVDTLQTYDSVKSMEQLLRKITDPNRSLQYSVVEPLEYEKRIMKFLFENVFVDAGEDFPWPIADVDDQSEETRKTTQKEGKRAKSKLTDIIRLRL